MSRCALFALYLRFIYQVFSYGITQRKMEGEG